jgi:sigma-B regulation protein RsbU (phosphoserine phosphatase)
VRFRTLLTLVVLLPLLAASMAVISVMYANANQRSRDMGARLLGAAASQTGVQVESQSRQAANLVRGLIELSGTLPLEDSDRLVEPLAGLLRANENITWISFSNPAGDFTGVYRDEQGRICSNQSHIVEGKTHLTEYVLADGGGRTPLREEADSGYDPRTRPFYVRAAGTRGIAWSDPYIFYNWSIPGISCSAALRGRSGELRGVFSVDYDLNRLSDLARQAALNEHAEVMVFTAQRVLIAHSSVRVAPVNNQRGSGELLSLADVADPITRAFEGQLRAIDLGDLSAEAPRTFPLTVNGEPYMASVKPVQLREGPWEYVAIVVPKGVFTPNAWDMSRMAILATAAALLVATAAALLLANRISTPLTALVGASERIGGGDLNVQVNLGRLREFRHLSDALHTMLANLRDWVRVRTAINLAMEVQRRLLPAAPPQIPELDVAGYSAYCDETGGDYFDYILVDTIPSRQFVVALGDVMGHGLPSALLMAGARGILRSGISAHTRPGDLLEHMNRLLFQDTEGRRFMTMCVASFDRDTGGCVWASAGHDPPIVFDPAANGFLEPAGGDVPLGVIEQVAFTDYFLATTAAGQVIVIGSDGVWETFSPEGEPFGKQRLKAIMRAHAGRPAAEIKDALITALSEFRGNSPMRDDVTFVVVKVTASAGSGKAERGAKKG